MMNLLGLKGSSIKIILASAGVILFVIFASVSISATENMTSTNIFNDKGITSGGIIGINSMDGGNNYTTFNEDDMKSIRQYLIDNNLWNTAVEKSNEIQLEFYKSLSKKMEETYIEKLTTYNRNNVQGYYTNYSCSRGYTGDYANDECDYNGKVTNNPTLVIANKNGKTCDDGTKLYDLKNINKLYYNSEDSKHIVGGKIIGKYPELLISSTMTQSWTTLDEQLYQNSSSNSDTTINNPLISGPNVSSMLAGIRQLLSNIFTWISSKEMVGVGEKALEDIVDEGALYSTFQFMPESKCTVTDVARYSLGNPPKMIDEDGNEVEYKCITSGKVHVDCKEKCETDDDGTEKCSTIGGEEKTTDGSPDTYYQHIDGSTKTCAYKEVESKWYKLSIDWVCLPSTESPVKCEVEPVKDDLNNTLYYKCVDIDENQVRTQIVDKIFDAYEANSLSYSNNQYMTEETVKKYIYGIDEQKKKSAKGLNPEMYKIDNETRDIVTKHIVMEILGAVEGRQAALADKDGNFYLQSYNRVLNKEQYEDALRETIFIKDDIDDVDENVYSKVIFGTFYNKYNTTQDSNDSTTSEEREQLSESRKTSLIQNIFYVYDEISSLIGSGVKSSVNISGTGLAQADASGYRARTSMPYYGTDDYNKYYNDYNGKYYGECSWYAQGRVNEILANAGKNYKWWSAPNGSEYCSAKEANDFIVSTDYTNPKKGAVISWGGGNGHNYGHVAIIEEVYYDQNGKAVSVDISESGLNINPSAAQTYSSNYIWNHDTVEIRKKQCSTGRCFVSRNIPVYMLKNRWTGYYFKCYIYLLKDDDLDPNKRNPDSSNIPANDIKNFIQQKFNSISGDSIENIIKYYDFLVATEGGTALGNKEKLDNANFLTGDVKITNRSEGGNQPAIEPGLNIYDTNVTYELGGQKYTYKLNVGNIIPRWVALAYWLDKSYIPNFNTVNDLISSRNLTSKLSSNQVHALMRSLYTYGSTSRTEKLLDIYKDTPNDYEKMWCTMSTDVYGTWEKNGKSYVTVLGNYFNMNEIIFELFSEENYASKSRNYDNYKYYTQDWIDKIISNATKLCIQKGTMSYPCYPNAKKEDSFTNNAIMDELTTYLKAMTSSNFSRVNKNYDCSKYYTFAN